MSDPLLPDWDISGLMPYDADAYAVTPQKDDTPAPRAGGFAYLGQAHTVDSFRAYVATYNFGTIPPDYVVLHHTAVPSTIYARYPTGAVWDSGESGMGQAQIMAKRKAQLDSIMRYYRDSLGWNAGPHLFIDERWIWLFTPMATVGIHAAQGNSYRDNTGRLHYSIGLEVVGYYEHVRWPGATEANTAAAVAILQKQLGTFFYVDKPWVGGISAHRHYNKPYCPGAAIQPGYYMPVLESASTPSYPRYIITAPCAVFTAPDPASPLASGPSDGQTRLTPGQVIQVNTDTAAGWYHVSDGAEVAPGIGFLPASYARPQNP